MRNNFGTGCSELCRAPLDAWILDKKSEWYRSSINILAPPQDGGKTGGRWGDQGEVQSPEDK